MTQPWYARGPRGFSIHSGAGAPAGGLGLDSDTYVNTSNGDVYTKTGGAWAVTGNIKGPSGGGKVEDDDAPKLGGNLDLNGKTVGSATAGDLTKLHGAGTLTGNNSGDQDLSGYATTSALTSGLAAKADLSGGKLLASQVPDIALVQFLGTVANQTAMLTLTGEIGDWCIRSDTSTVFILNGDSPATLGNWTQVAYPAAPVASVANKTGAVTLVKGDVGLGSVDNTADADKNVATATKLATARKINGVDFDGTGDITIAVGGSGDVTGQSASVDGEVALFSGTSGKAVKRATVSGIPKMASGVLSAATEGTDYYKPTGTDVALSDGGTGASTAAGARANLGVSKYLGTVANQSGMTALTGNVGDWCVRTDLNSVFVLTALPATTAGNWLQPDPDLPAKIHAATAKTSLVAADEIAIVDSEASNGLKRVTWDDLIAALWNTSAFTDANWGLLTYFFQQEASLLVNVSSAAITLTADPGLNVFTGSTARTWTLPPVAGNTGKVIRIKNRASQTLTISRAGSDQIYTTAAGNTATVAAGASLTLVNDGTYWVTN